MRQSAAFLAALGLGLGSACPDSATQTQPPPDQQPVPMVPLARPPAGDGGFVRPASAKVGDGGLSHVVVDPMEPESLYLSGQEAFLAGDFERAADQFRRSLRLKPGAKAWHALGDTLMSMARFGEAAEAFEEAVTLEPTKRLSWMRRGRCLSSAGKPVEAAEAFHKAFELKPDDAGALRDEADALLEAKRDEQAVERLRQAITVDPSGAAKDYKVIGESCSRREKWADAVAALMESAKLHPDPGIQSELGEALVHVGDIDAARAAFEEAARLDPKDPLAPETVAEIKLKQGDVAGARASFAASIAAKDRPLPHLALGRLDLKDGKKDDAKKQADKALAALKGDDTTEVREVAGYAVELGSLDVAEKLLSLLDVDDGTKKDASLYLDLAHLRAKLKNDKGAKAACEKAKALLPKDDKTVCPPK